MKGVLIVIVFGLATAATFYFVWMNRASEKMITAVIPIAVAALVGVFLAVFVFGEQAPITAVFPSSFQYRIEDKSPWSPGPLLWGRRFISSLFAPAQLYKQRPEVFSDPNDEFGQTLYHHLLHRSLVDWIGERYRGSWQTEILDLELPSGRMGQFGPAPGAAMPSKLLTTEEISRLMDGNIFANIHAGIPPQIALPPGTQLRVQPPKSTDGVLEMGEILLENKFCRLSIQTQKSFWMRGVGVYKQLAGLSDEANNKLGTTTYIVRVRVNFNRLRSGHPQMPKYRHWAAQLVEQLQTQFDEQIIWARTKEDYLFSKQADIFGPVVWPNPKPPK